jgi:predicted dehydrogenase
VHAFVPARTDPESGVSRAVGTPDSVQVLAVLQNGARALYQFSGVMPFNQGSGVRFFGTEGVLHYDFAVERIYGATRRGRARSLKPADLEEIPIPSDKAGGWRVEADFVEAIRQGTPIRFTDFARGVDYMEFTEAVARSALQGHAVDLPLQEFVAEDEQEVVQASSTEDELR